MKGSIEDLVATTTPGNIGVDLHVFDNDDKHLGELRVARGSIAWCPDSSLGSNGHGVKFRDLVERFVASRPKT